MNWWKKMFKESVGNTKTRAVDDDKDYNIKDYSDDSAPVVLNEDGTISSAFHDHEKPTLLIHSDVDACQEIPVVKPLDLMKVTFVDSPNKSSRPSGQKPTHIVLHHTGPGSFNGIVNWLCNRDAKASAHYVVSTTGQVKQLVNTMKKAWHAGVSKWDGKNDVNNFSIGIEICNIGRLEADPNGGFYYEQGRKLVKYTGKVDPTGGTIVYPSGNALSGFYVPYPEKQLTKVVALCKALIEKYPEITRDNILTHYQISHPEGRKNDPFGLDVDSIKDMIFNA